MVLTVRDAVRRNQSEHRLFSYRNNDARYVDTETLDQGSRMTPDTAKRIAREIIEAGEKATPGPWKARRRSDDDSGFIQAPREKPEHGYDIEILGDDEAIYSTKRNDVDFIVLARNFAPEVLKVLLEELEKK
jgi:hypothetical protein